MFIVDSNFASGSTGIPLSAEPIFHIAGLAVTNSMIYGIMIGSLLIAMFTWAARRTQIKPVSKMVFAIESLVDFVVDLGEQNFGDRKKALKFMPLLLTLFVFILFSNLISLFPGVGTVSVATPEGEFPLLRAFTADLNATLAMAVLTVGTVQVAALRELGLKRHIKHYFTMVSSNILSPINLFVGLIEIMGEFIRVMTLSLRLFGVIYAGEVLINVVGQLAGNLGWAATFPVYLIEIFFGLIQAYLFMMLAMVYLAIATRNDHAEHDDHSVDTAKPVTIGT